MFLEADEIRRTLLPGNSSVSHTAVSGLLLVCAVSDGPIVDL